MEIRPIDAIHRGQFRPSVHGARAPPLDISLLGLIRGLPSSDHGHGHRRRLLHHDALARLEARLLRQAEDRRLPPAAAVQEVELPLLVARVPEPGGGQGAPRPPVPHAREVPLDGVGGRPAVELAPQVEEAFDGAAVEAVHGREVQDHGFEGGL